MSSKGMSSLRKPPSTETSSASGVGEETHPCRLLTDVMGKHALLPSMVVNTPEMERSMHGQPTTSASMYKWGSIEPESLPTQPTR
eukprot:2184393-Lingulodinium_polyedra.AAC.1